MAFRRILNILGLTAAALLLAVPAAWAFEGREGETVVIQADEVIDDDLFVAANETIIEGTVNGNVFAVGQIVRVNGTVAGDLFASAQEVVIDGSVEDAYVAAFAVTTGGTIEEDLLGVGYSLEHRSQASIGRDLLFAGFQALLDGNVGRDARIGGNSVRLAGTIGGDARIDVGDAESGEGTPPFTMFFPTMPAVPSIAAGLTVRGSAQIEGDLSYVSDSRVEVPGGVVAGAINFTEYVPEVREEEPPTPPSPARLALKWMFRQARRLATLLLLGAAMMWVAPKWARQLSDTVESQPLPSLGWGFVAVVAFVAVFIAMLVAIGIVTAVFGLVTLGELARRFIVLGGLITGAFGFSFSVLWRYVTTLIVSLLLGELVFRLFRSEAEHNRWLPMLVGVILFVILWAVPVLGWLVRLATALVGLGAIWIWARPRMQRTAAPAPAEA